MDDSDLAVDGAAVGLAFGFPFTRDLPLVQLHVQTMTIRIGRLTLRVFVRSNDSGLPPTSALAYAFF